MICWDAPVPACRESVQYVCVRLTDLWPDGRGRVDNELRPLLRVNGCVDVLVFPHEGSAAAIHIRCVDGVLRVCAEDPLAYALDHVKHLPLFRGL